MIKRAITAEQARSLTDRIKIAVDGTWELIKQVYTTRAWSILGYETWDAYVDAEFGMVKLRLPREDRQTAIKSLRDAGMSQRAIASAVGASVGTVHKDLSTVQNRTVEAPSKTRVIKPVRNAPATTFQPPVQPEKITGLDGRTRTARPRKVTKPVEIIKVKLIEPDLGKVERAKVDARRIISEDPEYARELHKALAVEIRNHQDRNQEN